MKDYDKDFAIRMVSLVFVEISFACAVFGAMAEKNGSSIPMPVYFIGFFIFFFVGLLGFNYPDLKELRDKK